MTHFVPKLFITVLSFAMILCFSSAQSLKVGIVDMNRVFAEYYKTKDADKVVNEQKEAAKKELESINNDYKKLLDSYQNLAKELKDPAIGEALRKKKTEEETTYKRQDSSISMKGWWILKNICKKKRKRTIEIKEE